jgi:hypothetical protein
VVRRLAPRSALARLARETRRRLAPWRFRIAQFEVGARRLRLRLADGEWSVDGVPRPDLGGCEDVDFMATPYTNTPPLAARPIAPGEKRRLRIAWIRFPELEVQAVEQEYARLDSSAGETRYRYRNLASGSQGS